MIAPGGTRVLLVADRGGTGENFTDTVFDDDAATPIADGSARDGDVHVAKGQRAGRGRRGAGRGWRGGAALLFRGLCRRSRQISPYDCRIPSTDWLAKSSYCGGSLV